MDRKNPLVNFVHLNCSCFGFTFVSLYFSVLVMMALTHYVAGTALVIFRVGYVILKKWWSIGFVISIVDIVVMIAVGLVWWKILGFY
ncbi:hypothetical protein AJ938_00630 [Campylobacter sp. BCW_6879]|nr:hypothetical protein AJ938_00630 [Campylobacter sp. BCW_6879]